MRSLVVGLLFAAGAVAQPSAVETAARARQAALRTVEFQVRYTSAKEAGTDRLVFDGSNARFEKHTTSAPVRDYLVTDDGHRTKVILQWYQAGGNSGNIGPPHDSIGRSEELLPLSFATRPLDPLHCAILADTLTPAGTADVNGRTCDEYTGALNTVPVTLWFDPAAGHSLRRLRHGTAVTDVESSDDNPAGVWLPTRWTTTRTTPAGKAEVREFVVERAEVGKAYPTAEFDPPWPAGVAVYDLVDGGEYVSDANGELHRTDGWQVYDHFKQLWWVPAAAVVVSGGLVAWRMWRTRNAVG